MNRRVRLLLAVLVGLFGVMLLRAGWLQAVRASSLSRLAQVQQRQTVTMPARRGTLYDRNGVELAIGEQATTVYADPRRPSSPPRRSRARRRFGRTASRAAPASSRSAVAAPVQGAT